MAFDQLKNMRTLVDLARQRADGTARRSAYVFLTDGDSETSAISYGELDRRARAIAAWLQSLGAQGKRAILLYPPGLDYISAFFGCLYAEVVAVPAYPPQLKQVLGRLRAVLAVSGAIFALTTAKVRAGIDRLCRQDPGMDEFTKVQWIETDVPRSFHEEAVSMVGIDTGYASLWEDRKEDQTAIEREHEWARP